MNDVVFDDAFVGEYSAENYTDDDTLWDPEEDLLGFSSLINTAFGFGIAYVVLGCIAILLNGIFLSALLSKRSQFFSHIFYVMLLNFVLIDTIKGFCSILFALKLLKSDMDAAGTLWMVKLDQIAAFLLRFSNLATILNLTMITANEYCYICHPLRYPAFVTRARVLFCLSLTWVVSFALTMSNAVFSVTHRSILVNINCLDNELDDDAGVIVFCVVCLAVTATSYIILLRIVSKVVRADMNAAEAAHLQLSARPNQADEGSECPPTSTENRRRIMKRHKFVVVIGTVIVVYAVYLTAYAVLQILQLINMASGVSPSNRMKFVYVKYICYGFISLHSTLQPLCYLRMREFRTLLQKFVCQKRRSHTELTFLDTSDRRFTRPEFV